MMEYGLMALSENNLIISMHANTQTDTHIDTHMNIRYFYSEVSCIHIFPVLHFSLSYSPPSHILCLGHV